MFFTLSFTNNALINKHFPTILTSVCCVFLVVFLVFFPVSTFAANPLLTVENVKVDVTAKNALAAREEAFLAGERKAFIELSTRLIPDYDVETQARPSIDVISSMIQDFEITNEQLSAVRYIGTYTFRFDEDAVGQYFGQYAQDNAQSLVTAVSAKRILLPFLNLNNRMILWEPENIWMSAWNEAGDLQSGVSVPLELPIGDIQDIQDIDNDQALSFDDDRLHNMAARYGASGAIIAIATPDYDLTTEGLTAGQRDQIDQIMVEVYQADHSHLTLIKQISVPIDAGLSDIGAYGGAVDAVRDALQQDWQKRTSLHGDALAQSFGARVSFSSMQEWLAIKSQLLRVGVVDDVVVKSLSPQQADLDLVFKGDIERLSFGLQQAGIFIRQIYGDNGNRLNILDISADQSIRF